MICRIEKIGLSLEANDELLGNLVKIGKCHYPNEFGGFLIGYYSDENKHLHITDTILPKSFNASKYSFERSAKGIAKKLKYYYNVNPRKFYVGEWHTHPKNSSIPSSTDITAIKNIVNSQSTCISNPVVLIIGYFKILVDFGFYVWFENKLYKYE